MGDLHSVQKKKKHLNGVICTFQSLPLHFAEKSLIRHWSEPEVWSRAGHTLSASAVIIQPGNCQEIEWQTGLKINPCQTLRHTLWVSCSSAAPRWCLCCIMRPCVYIYSRGHMRDAGVCVLGGHALETLAHTHTHTLTSGLFRPPGWTNRLQTMWLYKTLRGRWMSARFYTRGGAHTVRCCHAVETCLDPPSFSVSYSHICKNSSPYICVCHMSIASAEWCLFSIQMYVILWPCMD